MGMFVTVAMCILTGVVPAQAYDVPHALSTNTFAGPDGLDRSLTVAEGSTGLHFDLQPGDEVVLTADRQIATLISRDGTPLIQFDSPTVEGADDAIFAYEGGTLTAVADAPAFGTFGCPAASGISFGWSILWAGLVCVPAALGTGGVGGFICGAIGSGISSFVPWDKVCG